MSYFETYSEKINEILYDTRERVKEVLSIVNTFTLFLALGSLIYSLGFDLENDEITRVFNWLQLLIVVFVIDYILKMVYETNRVKYFRQHFLESVMIVICFVIFFFLIFGIEIIYFVFLLLGFTDYRLFYEFFIAIYIIALAGLRLVRLSQSLSSIKIKPATTLTASFIVLILLGALILMLPDMTTAPGGISFLEALFISTSAACVTGLTPVTVAYYFTIKGQLVILFLFQLGGIGIVSFATFFSTFMSRGMGMKQQAIIQDVLSAENLSSAGKTLRQVILLTFGIETLGAIAMFFSWGPDVKFYSPVRHDAYEVEYLLEHKQNSPSDSLRESPVLINQTMPINPEDEFSEDATEALEILFVAPTEEIETLVEDNIYLKVNNSLNNKIYFSIFHSVSAFCNAGFNLFPEGLVGKGLDKSYVLHLLIACIVICGSIGFSTLQELISPREMRKRLQNPWKRWSLGSAISVNMYIILTLIGLVIFYFAEQEKTLEGKTVYDSLVISFFQSTATRSSGFNVVDLGVSSISTPTYIMLLFMMFVGASSGSTGGGIKTSTFLLLTASATASIQGKKTVEIGRRTIAPETINRAFSIVAFAIAYISLGIFLLSITQPNADIRDLFFELISAFATVGLSTGITGSLNEYSQVILIISMYVGRVGTLTLALALSKRVVSTSYKYPTTHIMVG